MQLFREVCEMTGRTGRVHVIELGRVGHKKAQIFHSLLRPFGVEACRNGGGVTSLVWARFSGSETMPTLESLNTAKERTLLFIRLKMF